MSSLFILLLLISTVLNSLQDGINFHKKPKGSAMRDLWHILKQADRIVIIFTGYFGITTLLALPVLSKIWFILFCGVYLYILKAIWKIIYKKYGQKVSEFDTSWRFSAGKFLDKLLGLDK